MEKRCTKKCSILYSGFKSKISYLAGGVTLALGAGLISGRYGDTYGEIKRVEAVISNSTYCPAGMVVVPPGHIFQGNFGGVSYKDRKFNSEIVGVASFCMDASPIAISQYNVFLDYAKANPEGFSTKKIENDDEDIDDEEEDDEDDDSTSDSKERVVEVITFEGVEVSPDRSAWKKVALDSESSLYKFLDAMSNEYFDIDAYRNYPMVCVSHAAANLFAKWRSMKLMDYRSKEGLPSISPFRLPSASEYDFASRGGAYQPIYSFGGPEPRNSKGVPFMNAKLKRGVYGEAGYYGPAPSGKFNANAYGLYDMSGNVAAWTSTNELDEHGNKLYMAMGGSWRHLAYFAQVGNSYSNYGEADCGIGIRCVVNMPINKV